MDLSIQHDSNKFSFFGGGGGGGGGVGKGENRHFSRATRSVSCARFAHTLAKIIKKKKRRRRPGRKIWPTGTSASIQLVPGPPRLSSVPNLEYDAAFENVSGPR